MAALLLFPVSKLKMNENTSNPEAIPQGQGPEEAQEGREGAREAGESRELKRSAMAAGMETQCVKRVDAKVGKHRVELEQENAKL